MCFYHNLFKDKIERTPFSGNVLGELPDSIIIKE